MTINTLNDIDSKSQEHPRSKFLNLISLVVIICFLISASFLLYPSISTIWNNYQQNQIAQEYSRLNFESHQRDSEIIKTQPYEEVEKRNKIIEQARDYNNNVSTPILDPWLSRITPDNKDYQHYLTQLKIADSEIMSQIVIPKVGVNLPIFHGSDVDTLEKGVGHLYGSSLPIGEEGKRSVLTGHTGLSNATIFDNLDRLESGDRFYLNTLGMKMAYEINQIEVVEPEDTDGLQPIAGKDLVTLITCTPYGVNSHRLVITGERVTDQKALEALGLVKGENGKSSSVFEEPQEKIIQQWMIMYLFFGALLLIFAMYQILSLILSALSRRKNQRKTSKKSGQ